jgi:hypothetical protein
MFIPSKDQLKQVYGGCTIHFNDHDLEVKNVDCNLATLMTNAFVWKLHSQLFGFGGENPHLEKAQQSFDSGDIYRAYQIVTEAIRTTL